MADSAKYVIGLDLGTLSGRAVVARVSDGRILGTHVTEYAHGVMDRKLTAGDGQSLPPEFALQVPNDYVEVLKEAIPAAIKDAGIDKEDIIGIGVDATSATVFVTDAEGKPLNEYDEFKNNPHAYIKLWKHHGAQEQADRLVAAAEERGEDWLPRYGGVLSSELLMPKALELYEKAPEVYEKADVIVELLDWVTWKLTGERTQAAGDSGYKRQYQDGEYPSEEYLESVSEGFGKVFSEKMNAPVLPLGAKVGEVTEEAAELTGLPAGIAVASGNIDAHVHVAGVNAVRPGQMTAIMGTSSCYIVNSEDYKDVPGIFGTVDGGAVEGLWGFEGGQSAVGDVFAWFIDNCVPEEYTQDARNRGISIHQYFENLVKDQEIGEHGIVALDWHNGNRSILSDARLSGLIVGQSLTSSPEDTYRALLEATCFTARTIIENFVDHGVPVTEIVAAGGLLKNKTLMQMMADITRLPITITKEAQAGALGSAVFAAVAAGAYDDVRQAADAMAHVEKDAYTPNEEASKKYDELFEVFMELHDYFGRESKLMHKLKTIRAKALESKATSGRKSDIEVPKKRRSDLAIEAEG